MPIDNQSNSDKSTEHLQRKSVKVMLTNACSIISKLDELRERIWCRPPDVIAITESWLRPEISDAEISIDGFFQPFVQTGKILEVVESSFKFLRG